MKKPDTTRQIDIVAIMPAAGYANRLPELTGSKEMIPIGTMIDTVSHQTVSKPVCLYLLEKYRKAGISKCFIVLRKEKQDIPAYLGLGENVGVDLSYIMIEESCGTACTIDRAYHLVKHAIVVLGFPDILFSPDDSFTRLLHRIEISQADVVLGLFPADKPEKTDMVSIDDRHQVRSIIIKPAHTDLRLTWGIAVWKPTFSRFLHEYLLLHQQTSTDSELHIGEVINKAMQSGMTVVGEMVSSRPYLDIGTPDDLIRAKDEKAGEIIF